MLSRPLLIHRKSVLVYYMGRDVFSVLSFLFDEALKIERGFYYVPEITALIGSSAFPSNRLFT
jgi:hypothetical protein